MKKYQRSKTQCDAVVAAMIAELTSKSLNEFEYPVNLQLFHSLLLFSLIVREMRTLKRNKHY